MENKNKNNNFSLRVSGASVSGSQFAAAAATGAPSGVSATGFSAVAGSFFWLVLVLLFFLVL